MIALKERAKGGIICVCPMSGSVILKLYASLKQFPAILYNVLQDVERQGFVCREIMVDTFVVNLSNAAEEVAAMFKTRIIPISAGTPQELAYAERAVRTIAEKSRAMLLGAPHLPKSMWGLADLHAGNVHDVLPQPERGNRSPYEIRHNNKKPDIEHLYLKVFGCPCQYAPIDGPDHKRASKTEWGYYLGIQWPMCLVMNSITKKIISVSRKKLVCHEGMYAFFDPTQNTIPNATIKELDTKNEMTKLQQEMAPAANQQHEEDKIRSVHSVKVLRESSLNDSLNEALPPSHPENQGESLVFEPDSNLDEDSLTEKIREIKKGNQMEAESQYHQIVETLKNSRAGKQEGAAPEEYVYGADISTTNILKERRNLKDRKRKAEIQSGDQVKIKTIRFGKQYAKGRPEYTRGKVVSVKGKKTIVLYEGGDETYATEKTHLVKYVENNRAISDNVVATVCYKGKWYKRSQTFYTIMATLEVGSALKRSEENDEANWPKDFYEALVRKD